MLAWAVIAALAAVAVASWFYAVYRWVKAVRRRRPEVSLGALLTQGFKSFDATNFLSEGQAHHARFVRGVLVCLVTLLALIGVAIAQATFPPP